MGRERRRRGQRERERERERERMGSGEIVTKGERSQKAEREREKSSSRTSGIVVVAVGWPCSLSLLSLGLALLGPTFGDAVAPPGHLASAQPFSTVVVLLDRGSGEGGNASPFGSDISFFFPPPPQSSSSLPLPPPSTLLP